MSDLKEKVLNIIQNLPEDVSYDDILEAIQLQKQIAEGLSQLEQGEFYSHKEIKEIIKSHKSGLTT